METAEIRDRGELTVPKKIRETYHLEPGQTVEFIPLGKDAVLMTHKQLELKEARQAIQKILKQTKASPEDILKGLDLARQETYEHHYGRKKR
ncbi:MAG: AbrB/MazE/SpoVT family DNA-binding domain-containing protein [Deltaproteobacteria bacterium]|nr:MAG: AbrB/MazE/SpoVT family DNA-binding domain-containing protein [Deltaproteobacteria bacterium]